MRFSYSKHSRGFIWSADFIFACLQWAVLIGVTAGLVGGIVGVGTHQLTKMFNEWRVKRIVEEMQARAKTEGRFTPYYTVKGTINCPAALGGKCYEIDFYKRLAGGNVLYSAYNYTPDTNNPGTGTFQRYAYSALVDSTPSGHQVPCTTNVCAAADQLRTVGSPVTIDNLWFHWIPTSQLASASQSAYADTEAVAIIAGLGDTNTLVDSTLQFAAPDSVNNNAAYVGVLSSYGFTQPFTLAPEETTPIGLSENVSYYTPTPPPPITISGSALVYHWPLETPNPNDPTMSDTFTVSETNYQGQFHSRLGSCANVVKYTSANTIQAASNSATFTMAAEGVKNAEGTFGGDCQVFVYDQFANWNSTPEQVIPAHVMGWLEVTSDGTNWSFNGATLNASATVTSTGDEIPFNVQKDYDGTALQLVIDTSPGLGTDCSTYGKIVAKKTTYVGVGQTATQYGAFAFELVNENKANAAVQCQFTVANEVYPNEPGVIVDVTVEPTVVANDEQVWPQHIKYPQTGKKLDACPNVDQPQGFSDNFVNPIAYPASDGFGQAQTLRIEKNTNGCLEWVTANGVAHYDLGDATTGYPSAVAYDPGYTSATDDYTIRGNTCLLSLVNTEFKPSAAGPFAGPVMVAPTAAPNQCQYSIVEKPGSGKYANAIPDNTVQVLIDNPGACATTCYLLLAVQDSAGGETINYPPGAPCGGPLIGCIHFPGVYDKFVEFQSSDGKTWTATGQWCELYGKFNPDTVTAGSCSPITNNGQITGITLGWSPPGGSYDYMLLFEGETFTAPNTINGQPAGIDGGTNTSGWIPGPPPGTTGLWPGS